MGKEDYSKYTRFIFLCHGDDCKRHNKELKDVFEEELENRGIDEETKILKLKCTGRCKEAPVMVVNNLWLTRVKEKNIPDILDKAFPDTKS